MALLTRIGLYGGPTRSFEITGKTVAPEPEVVETFQPDQHQAQRPRTLRFPEVPTGQRILEPVLVSWIASWNVTVQDEVTSFEAPLTSVLSWLPLSYTQPLDTVGSFLSPVSIGLSQQIKAHTFDEFLDRGPLDGYYLENLPQLIRNNLDARFDLEVSSLEIRLRKEFQYQRNLDRQKQEAEFLLGIGDIL